LSHTIGRSDRFISSDSSHTVGRSERSSSSDSSHTVGRSEASSYKFGESSASPLSGTASSSAANYEEDARGVDEEEGSDDEGDLFAQSYAKVSRRL
jgi:hypothetical protein